MMQKSEADQREREQQYRSIFAATVDGLIVHDLETGLVVEANPAACLMHGYEHEELIGLLLTSILHFDSQPTFHENILALHSDGLFQARLLHVHRDGSTFYVEWHGTIFEYQGLFCSMATSIAKRVFPIPPNRPAR